MYIAKYCKCEHPSSATSEFNDWYEWNICCDCDKPIKDSQRNLDHCDGEDHRKHK